MSLSSHAGMAHNEATNSRNFASVLAALYGHPFEVNLSADVDQISGILATAEYLGCVDIVARQVDSMLLQTGNELFRFIASAPDYWALVGFRIKSFIITKEAIIHLVGIYPTLTKENHRTIPEPLQQLIRDKVDILKDTIHDVSLSLIGYYLPDMVRNDGPIRGSKYSSSILKWAACSLAKTFVGQLIFAAKGKNPHNYNYPFFRTIATNDPEFLSVTDMNLFFETFNMLPRGRGNVKNHVESLKRGYAAIADRLMENNTNLRSAVRPPYFLFTDVTRREMTVAWAGEAAAAAEYDDDTAMADGAASESDPDRDLDDLSTDSDPETLFVGGSASSAAAAAASSPTVVGDAPARTPSSADTTTYQSIVGAIAGVQHAAAGMANVRRRTKDDGRRSGFVRRSGRAGAGGGRAAKRQRVDDSDDDEDSDGEEEVEEVDDDEEE